MTLDNYDDQIENNLSMIPLIRQERKQKENQVVVYGRAFPNEIWEIIKEYNDWTDESRDKRKKEATFYQIFNSRSRRAGRIAPTVRIGDEVCDGKKFCGRVVKIQKASLDIERYSYVGFKRTVIDKITPSDSSLTITHIYKWKKDMVKKVRWIGTYQLGDNGGGYIETHFSKSENSSYSYCISNKGWVMGCSVIRVV